MLEVPYIKFIHILSYLNKMDKKILCSIFLNSFKRKIKDIKGVNQQETLLDKDLYNFSLENNNKGSSETTCDITYNFDNYINLLPQHKRKINKQFLQWFIGFTEGDGSFIISKNKIYFDITQNLQDIQVLYHIKKELGFGKVLIRNEEARKVGVFYVTGKENFERLIRIFNGNLSTLYKKEQFEKWLTMFNIQYSENIICVNNLIIPSLSHVWISGFSDAEGCFYSRVKECKTSKIGRAPHLTFSISQKELYIIKVLRDLFLNPIDKSSYVNIKYDKSWNGWVFHCSSFTKLKVIINYFSKYPLKTKKSLAFNKWCKIHDMILNKHHLTLEGLNKIHLLSKNINKLNIIS
jgi:hypothetical protein